MNDAEIVERVLDGDPSQFQEIVARYKGFVFRTAYAVTGRTADAEDVLQEAFLSAYQGLASLKDRANVRGWLYGITYHTAQDWLRRHIRSRTVEQALDGVPEKAAPDGPKTGESEMMERVLGGLQELPETLRQVMMLRYVDGLSYREIAQTLGVTESAVGERLWRARQQFEKVLVSKGIGPN